MCDLVTAGACFAQDADARLALSSYVRQRKATDVPQLDVEALSKQRPDLAGRLAEFADANRRLWDAHRTGAGGVPYVVAARDVVAVRQRDDATGRTDLADQLASADKVVLLARLVEMATSATCDWDELVKRASVWGGVVEHDGKNGHTVVLNVEGAQDWPAEWGGAARANELQRQVIVEVNHAAWRDRRVRRLVSVSVTVFELWPDTVLA